MGTAAAGPDDTSSGDVRPPQPPGILRRTATDATVKALLRSWIAVVTPVGLLSLLLVGLVDRYDAVSYRSHAERLRSWVPWRWSRPVAFLPVAAQLPGLLFDLPVAADFLWLVVGLAACELYSVCFHRESYIAAFEPQWIPLDSAPLGARPSRVGDRRLHQLVRIQAMYLVPLIAASLIVDGSSPIVSWILCLAFVAKFVAPAWVDYEAYFHWDMHCSVLTMPSSPSLTRLWRGVCEWVLGPAVGSLPHLYSIEHLTIHHPANAGPRDVHSPLPYQRTSVLEFCHYAVKTILVLATTVGVVQHRRCSRLQRMQLLGGAALVWLIAVGCIIADRPLGYWLAAAINYRGTNTAIAQYVWHGLHDMSGSSNPLSTTILWLPSEVPSAVLPGRAKQAEGDLGQVTEPVHPTDGLLEIIPSPGSDWAFFDNYHLVHHLHPRAHFADYPRLLDKDLPRVLGFGSPVLTLDAYPTFFSDLMAAELDRVAAALVTSEPADRRHAMVVERLRPWPGARSSVAVVTDSRSALARPRTVATLAHLALRAADQHGRADRRVNVGLDEAREPT